MLNKYILIILLSINLILGNEKNQNLIYKKKSTFNQRKQNQNLAELVYNRDIITKKTKKTLGNANDLNIAILHAAMKNIPTTSKFVNTFRELRKIYNAGLIKDYTNYMENLQYNLKEKMKNLPEYRSYKQTHSKIIKKMKKFFARHKLKSFVTFHLRQDDLWGTHFLSWIDFFRLQKYFFGPFKYYILDCYKIRQFKSMCKEFLRDHVPLLDIPFPPEQKNKYIHHFNEETPDNIIDDIENTKKNVKKNKSEEEDIQVQKKINKSTDDKFLIGHSKGIIKKNTMINKNFIQNDFSGEGNRKKNVDINISFMDKSVSEENEDSLSSLSDEEITKKEKSESVENKNIDKIKYDDNNRRGKSTDDYSSIKKSRTSIGTQIINKKKIDVINDKKNDETNLPLILRKSHKKDLLDVLTITKILKNLKKLRNKQNDKKKIIINTNIPVNKHDKIVHKDDYLNFFDGDLTQEIKIPKIRIDLLNDDGNIRLNRIKKINNIKNDMTINKKITGFTDDDNFSHDYYTDKIKKKNNFGTLDEYLDQDINTINKTNFKINNNDKENIYRGDIKKTTFDKENIYGGDVRKNTFDKRRSNVIKRNTGISGISESTERFSKLKYDPKIKFNRPDITHSDIKSIDDLRNIVQIQKLKQLQNKKKTYINTKNGDGYINNKSFTEEQEDFSKEENPNPKKTIITTNKTNTVRSISDEKKFGHKKFVFPKSDEEKEKSYYVNGKLIPKSIRIKKHVDIFAKEKGEIRRENLKKFLKVKINKHFIKEQEKEFLPTKGEITIDNSIVIPKLIIEPSKINEEENPISKIKDENSPKTHMPVIINKKLVTNGINQDYMNKMLNRYRIRKGPNILETKIPLPERDTINYFKRRNYRDYSGNYGNSNLINKRFIKENIDINEGDDNKNYVGILDEIENHEPKNKNIQVKKRRIITDVILIEIVDCEECIKETYMDIFVNSE